MVHNDTKPSTKLTSARMIDASEFLYEPPPVALLLLATVTKGGTHEVKNPTFKLYLVPSPKSLLKPSLRIKPGSSLLHSKNKTPVLGSAKPALGVKLNGIMRILVTFQDKRVFRHII